MDYISKFDIELDRDIYYAGEKLTGHIVVQNIENLKVQGIRLTLRGKVHIEWKIMRTGERRTVKQDHYYIDDKTVIWGKDKNEEGSVPILPRGNHRYPFQFQLPESALPCSFESKMATIRYYLRVVIDMPYASSPQGIKYFTIIGPHIDCMDERFLSPQEAQDKNNKCCFCCGTGPLVLKATLDRSGYCCGENIRLKAEIQNNSDESVWLVCKLMQYVQFFINKGVLGLNKDTSHKVFEVEGSPVAPFTTARIDDLSQQLQVPVMPPTLLHVCQNVEIFYSLKVYLHMEKTGDVLHIEFPITIGTVPFRIPNSPAPEVRYENAVSHVEGGIYISSEFQFGGVYMGDEDEHTEEVVLYRPVYVCVPHAKLSHSNSALSDKKDKDQISKDSSKEKLKANEQTKPATKGEEEATVTNSEEIVNLKDTVSSDATDKKGYAMTEVAKVNVEASVISETSAADLEVTSKGDKSGDAVEKLAVSNDQTGEAVSVDKGAVKTCNSSSKSGGGDADGGGGGSGGVEDLATPNAVHLVSVESEPQAASSRKTDINSIHLSNDNSHIDHLETAQKTSVEGETLVKENSKTATEAIIPS
ncbi:uncharacterized protein LOC106871347 [Octopus bimaculoides]|uniref:Arrestin C-terminal-like domain-containing protein n=1 Tax=Octopus bimaculoides TaxID=37653 RepID=A0A0L8HEW4_OCTBM|nr:uncharacterized protein LOC106871347 [Octopus bimaculoides]XP_014773236.1 uncharacterized protein LOC106871347 [Octopus bimaculoides]XP_052831881.1 uncharacterized protein LOC106871347 [Octopus bimaculoides]XP_052831882.1 uncharacterized protein LOC106871347 [Octopus bimaculoides]|eukprot:XP_014773235.1 PREDICTED: uncharacterized protein LOC106871347 [Octopus bimaculoides]